MSLKRHQPSRPPASLLLWMVFGCGLAGLANAHNGRAAVAHLLQGIQIDGDFADWPPTTQVHPIRRIVSGENPKNADDLTAGFRVGFDRIQQCVYVGLEVRDDSVVLPPASQIQTQWREADGYEIYLDNQHRDHPVKIAPYTTYDASPSPRGRPVTEVAVKIVGNVRRYEWKFQSPDWSTAGGRITSPKTLGFDVALIDRDEDGSLSKLAWGSSIGDTGSPERLGDLVIPMDSNDAGAITGTVHWDATQKPLVGARLSIINEKDPALSLHLETDTAGQFEALELPSGNYTLTPKFGRPPLPTRTVNITPGSTTTINLSIPVAVGIQTPIAANPPMGKGTGQRFGLWQSFRFEDGLVGNQVECMVQDSDANLWIGTRSGLCSYDGIGFTCYTTKQGLPDNHIQALLIDGQNRLWIGTRFGLARLDEGHFLTYEPIDGLLNHDVRALAAGKEPSQVWIGTAGGLSLFDGGSFRNYTTDQGLSGNSVRSLAPTRKGPIWIGTDSGLSLLDGSHFTNIDTQDGLSSHFVTALAVGQDQEDELLVGTRKGLNQVNFSTGRPVVAPSPVSTDLIQSLRFDAAGGLWIGTERALYHRGGERHQPVTLSDGVPQKIISDIFADRDGIIWLATHNGLFKFLGNQIQRFNGRSGLDDKKVSALLESRDGRIWVGTDAGIRIISPEGDEATEPESLQSLSHRRITSLSESPTGEKWIGTEEGLLRFEGGTLKTFHRNEGLISNHVTAIQATRNGALWIGTDRGVNFFDGTSLTSYDTHDGLPGNLIRCIHVDTEDNLWVGTASGLGRFNGSTFRSFNTSDGLPDDDIRSLASRGNGTLLVGTHQGTTAWDGESFQAVDGLGGSSQSPVTSILAEGERGAWLGTENGLLHTDGRHLQRVCKRDGLPSDRIEQLLRDRKGRIWMGLNSGGLVRYHPQNSPPQKHSSDRSSSIANTMAKRKLSPGHRTG